MSATFATRPCDHLAPAAVTWLWKSFLPRGKITVLDGEPGVGKSLITIDLAARFSRGGPLPDGQALERPHVALLLNAEDDPVDTIRPQVSASGADLSRVIVADFSASGPPVLPECVPQISQLVYEHAADLLVLDPLSAFIPRTVALNDDRVRQALAPLGAMAAETGCAVLVVRHLGCSGRNAVYRRSGSVGVLGLARTGWLLAQHPEEPELRVLAVTKSQFGPPPVALGVRRTFTESGPRLEWPGLVDLSADELCVSQSAQVASRPRERAADFLTAALANGPRPVVELQKLAAESGVSWRTVERAKRFLGVVTFRSQQTETPTWCWRLPSLDEDGDLLRSVALRALRQLPNQINALHELRREGDAWDFAREAALERRKRAAPEG